MSRVGKPYRGVDTNRLSWLVEQNTILLVVFVLFFILFLALVTACLCSLHKQVQSLADDLERFKTETYDRERSLLSVKLPTISDEPGKAEPLLAELSAETESTVKSAAENVVTESEVSIAPSYDETDYLLRVLTAEGGSSYTMCGCVAQCMLNAYRRDGYSSQIEMLTDYGYTSPSSWISDAARQAYDDVWLSGVRYVDVEDALYFYSTRYCYSEWHETMRFITEVDGVRFFGRWERCG